MGNSQQQSALIQGLEESLKGEVRFDLLSKVLYRTDASIYEMEPEGVVIPHDRQDVVQTVKLAAEHGVPILPRGGGTSLAGQAVGNAIHLDVSKYMNKVLELNATEKWVRVQSGVVLDELNAFLKPHGLLFAPDVAPSNRANIGGMIGNNSCGVHSLIYGKTIDHVLALDVVLADGTETVFEPLDAAAYQRKAGQQDLEGEIYRQVKAIAAQHRDEIIARFPKVMRRVSGYNLDEFIDPARPFDLSKMVVGSEGTLCTVVEAKLKVVDLPRHTALVACHFNDIIESMEANQEALLTQPSAVEMVDKILLDQTKGSIEHVQRRSFLQGDPAAMLFVEYYGDTEAELIAKMDQLEMRLRERGLGYAFVQALGAAEQKNMVELRKAGLGLLMGMKGDAKPNPGVEDTCVPTDKLPVYVQRVLDLSAELGLKTEFYGHASVGVLHIRPIFNLKTQEGIETLRLLEERMSDMVLEYGGAMSAEHGDGLARSEWIEKMFGKVMVRAFAQVKQAFDPHGLMNPGKIVDAQPMDQNLRYGPDYKTAQIETHFSFAAEGGLHQAVEMCSGVGHCRKKLVGTMCPSYMATLDEAHSTRGRANALRAALSGRMPEQGLTSDKLHEVMDLCLECKACKSECPSNVDMAKLKYEFLAHYHEHHGFPLRSHLFGKIDRISRLAAAFAPVSNWIAGSRLNRWLLDRFVGIDKRRQMPHFASQTFSRWFAKRQYKRGGAKGQVLLFNDTFVEYNEPQIGIAATLILENAGYEVILSQPRACCGRPMLSKGFLKLAKQRAKENVALLAPYAEQGIPIVGIEPSCILTFRDDYLDLCDDPKVRTVADQVFMLEEFLVKENRAGNLGLEFTQITKQILVHGHCHQKALVGTTATLEVLNMPPGYNAEEISSGCCGMAGSFGYEKEHYEVSRQVGQARLFDVVNQAGPQVEIAAVGTSCRHQIADFTGRKARHWAEILLEALD
jgi:FAD/FMN-containing dehydrogenase/Fe-S oxidoreductase